MINNDDDMLEYAELEYDRINNSVEAHDTLRRAIIINAIDKYNRIHLIATEMNWHKNVPTSELQKELNKIRMADELVK